MMMAVEAAISFTCNICGAFDELESFATEPPTCSCGSNVRLRSLVHLLSTELFGTSIVLRDFPKLRSIRGLGISDQQCYAGILSDKLDYTNTFLDREPRFDVSERHPDLYETYDFILCADVLEHIKPPVERALDECFRLLKPGGFWVLTIYCNRQDHLREHFPDLHEHRLVSFSDAAVLINRRSDGTIQVYDNLIFHGGTGATLEMREFGASALRSKLSNAGFRELEFLSNDIPNIGVLFDDDVSQPLIARKGAFVMNRWARSELIGWWRAAEVRAQAEAEKHENIAAQLRMASRSRWLRLGRLLSLGPKFDAGD